jgi:multidrug efflux system outer membrane protein
MFTINTNRLPLLTLAGFAALSGCAAVGPNYKTPSTPVARDFANIREDGLRDDRVEARWWQLFRDPQLSRLVERSLANNPDLRVAIANLKEARALRSETTFDRYPTITAGADYNRRRFSENTFLGRGAELDTYSFGVDVLWELDLFGRIRRSVEARTAELEASEATRRDVVVSLIGEVARNYMELRGTQRQLAVALKNAENQKSTLKLTEIRLEAGRGTELDTSRAREQMKSTMATIPPLEASIKRAIYRLSVLTGQQPQALETELQAPAQLPPTPQLVSIGKPADLLRRRPDIRVAERNLQAATARIGVNTAELFPIVNIVGSNIGFEALQFSDLGKIGSRTYTIGPSISWSAFNWWRVKARIRQADARTEAQLARYEKTVLAALEETENALVNYGRQQVRVQALREAAQASEKAHQLAHLRYEDGIADFLTVLDAERRLLEVQDRLAASETTTATALVAVYKALGGGWELSTAQAEPPKAKVSSSSPNTNANKS